MSVVLCAEVSGEGAGAVRWRRRLVLRGKLTMHTAYERRDNASPAAVTAVAAARSGRGLAVGDARGRVIILIHTLLLASTVI